MPRIAIIDAVELRQLAYFLAVAEEHSFTRAANREVVVQSTVSAAVAALERELGTPLFDRSIKPVRLTDAGSALIPAARTALSAAQSGRDAIHQILGGLRGNVRVGSMTAIDILDLPGLIGRFHAEYPRVDIQLRSSRGGSVELARWVLDGELDIAFVSLPDRQTQALKFREMAISPMVAVLPHDHRLARQEHLNLRSLAAEPFIDSPAGYGNRVLVDRAFSSAGIERHVFVEIFEVNTAAEYVRNGLGIAIMPQFAVPPADPVLCIRPIADLREPWPMSAVTSAERPSTAALRALLAMVGNAVRS